MADNEFLATRKLQAEIVKAQRDAKWWSTLLPGLPQAAAIVAAALCGLIAAFASGVLDAKRDVVRSETTLLEARRSEQQREVKQLNTTILSLQSSIADLTTSENTVRTQRGVVKNVRGLVPIAKFKIDDDTFEITDASIHGGNPLSVFIVERSDMLSADAARDAIRELSRLKSLRRLQLNDVILDSRCVAEIGKIRSLNMLSLLHTEVSSKEIGEICKTASQHEGISDIFILADDFGGGEWLPYLTDRVRIRLMNGVVSERFAEELCKNRMRIGVLCLFNCEVPVGFLAKLADAPLSALVLTGTRIGTKEQVSVATLLQECASLKSFSVLLEKERFTPEEYEHLVREGERRGVRFVHLDVFQTSG